MPANSGTRREEPAGANAAYLGLALAMIALGLLVQWRGRVLGPVGKDMLGDALWGAMIVGWLGALRPGVRPFTRATIAFGVCAAVELSQLYNAPWIDALRQNRIARLALGSGFDPRDFIAYALGVIGAFLIDRFWIRRR